MTPRYSLVVPLCNEAGNILPLLECATAMLDRRTDNFEIVLVDDGSTDQTAQEIAAATGRWPQCRSLTHPRNLGQHVALFDGLQAARGEFILTLDGDGQNDPEDFPVLLNAVERDHVDVACGWRTHRHDSLLRRALSRLGNAARRRLLRDGMHDAGCQLRVLRRAVVAALFPCDFLQAFVPAIAAAAGFRVAEYPVRHRARRRGRTHFGVRELWWRPFAATLALRRRLRAEPPRAPAP